MISTIGINSACHWGFDVINSWDHHKIFQVIALGWFLIFYRWWRPQIFNILNSKETLSSRLKSCSDESSGPLWGISVALLRKWVSWVWVEDEVPDTSFYQDVVKWVCVMPSPIVKDNLFVFINMFVFIFLY